MGRAGIMLVIPAIDLKDGQCVRLRQGKMEESTVFSDDPIEMAGHWVEQGAQRLHVVDLNGNCIRTKQLDHQYYGGYWSPYMTIDVTDSHIYLGTGRCSFYCYNNAANKRDGQRTKKSQAVSKSVYEKITKAQEIMEAGDNDGALKILNTLRASSKLSE